MKFIKSEALNKLLLNALILLKDALFILLKYLILCTIGTLFLTVVKSESQMLKIISVNEIYIAPLIIFVIIAPSILSQFLKVPNGIELFKNLSNKIISNRRSLVLYGILPLVHAYSVGIKALSQFAFGTVMTHFLQMFLTLLLMDFFIAVVKERYLGTLFFVTPSNSTLSVEGTFTPYGRKNISSLTESGTKNLENSFTQGQINLNITTLLTPISRKFVKTPDGLYHFVNSRYVIVLFTLHKIRLFFKGMIKAIKYKSLKALSSVVEHEGKVMTSKQRLIYELVLFALVVVLFNVFYVWLSSGSLWVA